jgi:cyanate lyase
MLPEITQTILDAKSAKGLTFAELARAVGCHPVWLASVCYRQASPTHEQASSCSTPWVWTMPMPPP